MTRPPACAGSFYDASAHELRHHVQSLLHAEVTAGPAIAAVAPHAGLMYSGMVAGTVYGRVTMPRTVVLIGPNHTGAGPPISVWARGQWAIPGAVLPVAEDLADVFLSLCVEARADELAHQYEHSLEVQLPFLVARRPDITILPIVVGVRNLSSCLSLGLALASMTTSALEPPLLIASSDMTHCGPGFGQFPPAGLTADVFARKQDGIALKALQTLDEAEFHRTVEAHDISMCGYAPTTAVLYAARILGAQHAAVTQYATSAEVAGDVDRVVGYAGVIIN